jgi:hypothetical protein
MMKVMMMVKVGQEKWASKVVVLQPPSPHNITHAIIALNHHQSPSPHRNTNQSINQSINQSPRSW